MSPTLLPILILAAASTLLGVVLLAVGKLLGPGRQTAVKQMPYESGMDPIHDARQRFDVRFHLVAIAFLLFDVELLFLYPWAVASKHPAGVAAVETAGRDFDPSLMVFGEAMVFIALLGLGLAYAWRRGVFQWR